MASTKILRGQREEIGLADARYPEALKEVDSPPEKLYLIGDVAALRPGLAVVGARKATPYGIGCAKRFASLAARRNIVIVSGGARGCDGVSHEAALSMGAPTVAFLGGGLDKPYPAQNLGLFQRIIDCGGALVSENPWSFEPLPYTFRLRNRLIAGLGKATLIVEAGLPSGTFSTADAALALGREVLVVPGAITSDNSRGANRLLFQGATPIVDDESFADVLDGLFGIGLRAESAAVVSRNPRLSPAEQALLAALDAEVLDMESLFELASRYVKGQDPLTWLMRWLAESQSAGLIASYPGGRYGPCVRASA